MNITTPHQMPGEALLATDDITVSYGGVNALAGVSLHIAPRETVAVMGPSGSGKSTLLHCLSGILTPTHGEVRFEGRTLSGLRDARRSHTRLQHFGFVFQDHQLIPELPARENVALPQMLTGVSRSTALRSADRALEQIGIPELRKRRPGEMSGGQAQRVAIARALVGEPRVVFADEPSGALDQTTGHEVMQLLTATVAHAGAALVLVTHDRAVAQWCNRLVEIRDGLVHTDRLVEEPLGVGR
ncbi:ABC transporter ATP-binding protein [Kytococcus sedentarius]|uniref:ABC-type antimicrobial peptide transport system, ATPase component n=1 Tax=Kytococcus sedentarius (strain ATCC 14392 / DSM 20547 / JCM 11482 / CCUG 33030 / NBRC 15357 / NCTC 11040 / CCM 314 / 541) TaxID=478801 RepID=C7NEV5_KYTSD|nr:ABC transporter ATP-binding protein [Kytococcus sedentarius]ACV05779.1 ABC-type antimicrobial peptide transport system, ATPase component [Kytococcus sedentarius DSM 20547]STX12807.1 Lipoprotein-releasing system ATP-binding protein LolD [Kytococcus sedentarius]